MEVYISKSKTWVFIECCHWKIQTYSSRGEMVKPQVNFHKEIGYGSIAINHLTTTPIPNVTYWEWEYSWAAVKPPELIQCLRCTKNLIEPHEYELFPALERFGGMDAVEAYFKHKWNLP